MIFAPTIAAKGIKRFQTGSKFMEDNTKPLMSWRMLLECTVGKMMLKQWSAILRSWDVSVYSSC